MLEKILAERREMAAAKEREYEHFGNWTGTAYPKWMYFAASAPPILILLSPFVAIGFALWYFL